MTFRGSSSSCRTRPRAFPYELRHGELVKLVFPRMKHSRVQWQLRRLLERAAGKRGASLKKESRVFAPCPNTSTALRMLPSSHRGDGTGLRTICSAHPKIVIEMLSPSNYRCRDARQRKNSVLKTAASSFWIVDPNLRIVKSFHAGQPYHHLSFRAGDSPSSTSTAGPPCRRLDLHSGRGLDSLRMGRIRVSFR